MFQRTERSVAKKLRRGAGHVRLRSEKDKFAGKLQDTYIVIGVRELMPFGGRLRARGAIINGPEGKN
jgi:hypothetical protein